MIYNKLISGVEDPVKVGSDLYIKAYLPGEGSVSVGAGEKVYVPTGLSVSGMEGLTSNVQGARVGRSKRFEHIDELILKVVNTSEEEIFISDGDSIALAKEK